MTDAKTYWNESLGSARDRLIILPRGPQSMFVYWEWTAARSALFRAGKLDPAVKIRLFFAGANSPAAEYARPWDTLKMYIEPPQRGRQYYAMLEINSPGGGHHTHLNSNTILIPSGFPAGAPEDYVPSSGERMLCMPSSMEAIRPEHL
ncbi:MAG: DUF4912 domain-containing protein [Elusimicrobiaceae bacterium]|nr:DUF4912 domain-containing protein [Elusimicrobiaceae bacterium]